MQTSLGNSGGLISNADYVAHCRRVTPGVTSHLSSVLDWPRPSGPATFAY